MPVTLDAARELAAWFAARLGDGRLVVLDAAGEQLASVTLARQVIAVRGERVELVSTLTSPPALAGVPARVRLVAADGTPLADEAVGGGTGARLDVRRLAKGDRLELRRFAVTVA